MLLLTTAYNSSKHGIYDNQWLADVKRSECPGFESRWCLLRTSAVSVPRIFQCLPDETIKTVGPFYLVSMPEEVKYRTHGGNVSPVVDYVF